MRVASKREKRRRPMPVAKLPRETLRDLRLRSGLSAARIAKAVGYASTNGYITHEYEKWGDKPIPAKLVEKLIPLMVGRGSPPITTDELISISDVRRIRALVPRQQSTPQSHVPNGPLVLVRYRVERGVYVDKDELPRRSFGHAPFVPSAMYDSAVQFAAVVADDPGLVLHCVDPDQVPADRRQNRRCVYLSERANTGLYEVLLGTFNEAGEAPKGELVGVVIGAYSPE